MNLDISCEVNFDEKKLSAEIKAKSDRALLFVSSAVLKDSNYYIPKDTGTMEKSSIIHSRLNRGEIIWQTPYARKNYYNWQGGRFSHNKNPNATAEWFETAKSVKLKSWEKIANDQLNKNN